jgi:hypothetical protein
MFPKLQSYRLAATIVPAWPMLQSGAEPGGAGTTSRQPGDIRNTRKNYGINLILSLRVSHTSDIPQGAPTYLTTNPM